MSTDDVGRVVKDCGREATLVLFSVSDAALNERLGRKSAKTSETRARQVRIAPERRSAPVATSPTPQKSTSTRALDAVRAFSASQTTPKQQRATSIDDELALMTERHGRIGALAIIAATTDADDASTIENDEHRAVRLDSLSIGAWFKQTNEPDLGVEGRVGQLMHLGNGSATVEYRGTRKRVTIKGKPGERDKEFDAERGGRTTIGLSTLVVAIAAPAVADELVAAGVES